MNPKVIQYWQEQHQKAIEHKQHDLAAELEKRLKEHKNGPQNPHPKPRGQ